METIEHDAPKILVPEPSRARGALPATVPDAQPTSLIQAIASAASNPHVDMDRAERLFAMHQKMVAQQAEASFNDAMARAQSNMVPVITNRTNTHTNSKYANLAAIAKAIQPMYTAEGLSISFDSNRPVLGHDGNPIAPPLSGWFRTVGIVSHSAGHSRLHHIDLPSDDVGARGNTNKTAIQGVVSMTTYGRRVLECMVFNVAVEDSDGNAPKGNPKNAGQEKEPPGKPLYQPKQVTDNLPAWKKLVAGGTKTPDQIIKTVQAKYALADDQEKRIRTALTIKETPQ